MTNKTSVSLWDKADYLDGGLKALHPAKLMSSLAFFHDLENRTKLPLW
jgi:hypothetical protein